jgi:hypothetical protein
MGQSQPEAGRRIFESHPILTALVFGCFVAGVIVGLVEIGCRVYEALPDPGQTELTCTDEGFLHDDDLLGIALKPDSRVTCTKKRADGKVIFKATYSTDARGRRATPVESAATRNRYLLFFGCSFIFGEGLNDDETLPYYVGRLAACYRPYNYGVIGYGPQQMLAMLEEGGLRKQIPQRKGALIYSYMGEPVAGHIDRAIGSLHIFGWASRFPHYFIGPDGELTRDGNFRTGRPIRSLTYRALRKSAIVRTLGLNHPFRINEGHVELTARIIEESRRIYQEDFLSDDFYVVILPGAVKRTSDMLIAKLKESGVRVLDYRDRSEFSAPEYRIAEDEHPSKRWNQRMAALIVKDLGLDKEQCPGPQATEPDR